MNLKNLFNIALLLFFISYFSFLISRVILERSPVDALQRTGYILLLFLFLRIVILLIAFYKKKFNKKGVFIMSFYKYLDVGFFQSYLDKNPIFNIAFYYISLRIGFILKRFFFIIPIFVLYLPWIFSLVIFFYELLFENKILYSLYAISFCLLIKNIFKMFLFICTAKNMYLNELAFDKYFPVFQENTKQEFLGGTKIRLALLREPTLHNRTAIIYIWNCISDIQYTFDVQVLSQIFNKSVFPNIDKFIRNFNLTLFGFVFAILLIQPFSCFIMIDLIFIGLLVLFRLSLEHFFEKAFFSEALAVEKILIQIPKWTNQLRQDLLRKPFLRENDLVPFIPKNANQLSKEQFNKILLDEKLELLLLCENLSDKIRLNKEIDNILSIYPLQIGKEDIINLSLLLERIQKEQDLEMSRVLNNFTILR